MSIDSPTKKWLNMVGENAVHKLFKYWWVSWFDGKLVDWLVMIWTELIFVTNITNYICGEKISCGEILGIFEKFLEIFGDFATIYALSHGEKLSPKSTFGDKKWQICGLDMEGQLSNDGRSCERQSGCSSSAEYSNQSCLILSGTHNSNPLF